MSSGLASPQMPKEQLPVGCAIASMTVEQSWRWAKQQLPESDSAAADAKALLCHVLDCTSTHLHTHGQQVLTTEASQRYRALVQQRQQGTPVSYMLGRQDFWTLNLAVNEHTLIPRPETELLVEQTLRLNTRDNPRILDLGTGSGAIALALASELPTAEIIAVDRIAEAVALAAENARTLQLSNVQFHCGHWFAGLAPQTFDFIVTNPPYVETNSCWLDRGDVRFEPTSALVAGIDGLEDIRHIVANAQSWLKPGGWLLLEHGYNQAAAVAAMFAKDSYQAAQCLDDYSAIPRISYAQKSIA